jgi:hypothetical protein
MANKYMKKYLTSLIIKKMQIKTIVRYHFILLEGLLSKRQNKCLRTCGGKGTHMHYWWEYKFVFYYKNCMEVPPKN